MSIGHFIDQFSEHIFTDIENPILSDLAPSPDFAYNLLQYLPVPLFRPTWEFA